MTTLRTTTPEVKPSNPLPPDALDRFEAFLVPGGMKSKIAHGMAFWVDHFRSFRGLAATPKSFTQTLDAFRANLATDPKREAWQVDQARSAVVRFVAWWQHRRPSGPDTPATGSGVEDVSTTMIYIHVLKRGGVPCRSPLDQTFGATS